jgi:hypothetical protein
VVFLEVVKVPELKPPQSTHTGGQQLHMFLGFVPHKQTEMPDRKWLEDTVPVS